MKPINPIRNILHNCWALFKHYKSGDALDAIKFHVKSALICYLSHPKEEFKFIFGKGNLYKCQVCGVLWRGKEKK